MDVKDAPVLVFLIYYVILESYDIRTRNITPDRIQLEKRYCEKKVIVIWKCGV